MATMNLNTNTYVTTPAGTATTIVLSDSDANTSNWYIENNSTKEIFVASSRGAAITGFAFPASSTVGVAGKVILPGALVNFSKNIGDNYLNFIQAVAGTGNAYASPGSGD